MRAIEYHGNQPLTGKKEVLPVQRGWEFAQYLSRHPETEQISTYVWANPHNLDVLTSRIRTADKLYGVVSGPTTIGKDAVVESLVKRRPHTYHKLISTTSRAVREDDKPGDYEHVSREEFETLISEGKLLEYDSNYAGEYYGTPFASLDAAYDSGLVPLSRLTPLGTKNLTQRWRSGEATLRPYLMVSWYIVPLMFNELIPRLNKRFHDELARQKRITRAREDLSDSFIESADLILINPTGYFNEAVVEMDTVMQSLYSAVYNRQKLAPLRFNA